MVGGWVVSMAGGLAKAASVDKVATTSSHAITDVRCAVAVSAARKNAADELHRETPKLHLPKNQISDKFF